MATPTNGVTVESAVAGMDEKKYFQKVLSDIVNLNSWFTVAMFVGLSLATPEQVHSLEENASCDPDTNLRKQLVFFEIASFSFFIFSAFVGKTANIVLYLYETKGYSNPHRLPITVTGFYLAIYGTMIGCVFLVIAMVEVVQIKLGKLSCGSKYAPVTASILVIIVGPALLVFFRTVTYGLYLTTTRAITDRKARKTAASST